MKSSILFFLQMINQSNCAYHTRHRCTNRKCIT